MKPMISEILENASLMKSRKDKIKYLQSHDSLALRRILHACFDPGVHFLLPDDDPNFKPAFDHFGYTMLYSQSRKLMYFIDGGTPGLNQKRRETMFIEFLESIHPKDAKMMLSIRKKRMPFPTITENLIRETFPNLLSERQSEKEKEETTNVENT